MSLLTHAETATAPPLAPPVPWLDLPAALVAIRRDPVAWAAHARQTWGDIVRLRAGLADLVVVTHPELAQDLLVRGRGEPWKGTRGAKVLSVVVGRSVLTTDGEPWRQRRRILQPAFHRDCLRHAGATMRDEAERTAAHLAARADAGATVDLFEEMSSLTLQIAARAFFGVDLRERAGDVGHALEVVLERFFELVNSPLPAPERWPGPKNRAFHAALRTLDDVVLGILAERRAAEDPPADLLGLLMEARGPDGVGLSDQALRDEVLTMLLAGHETTASTLAWTLVLLSDRPDLRDALRAELHDVVGDGPIEVEHLERLTLLDQVLRESLRLYPPAWILARRLAEDGVFGGHTVKAGSFVFAPVHAIHRHPEIWDDPERFDPSRFAPDAPRRHRLAWMPFGAGGRKCIGEAFAMMEARMAMATLLRRVDLPLVDGATPTPFASVTLRPLGATARPARLRPPGAVR